MALLVLGVRAALLPVWQIPKPVIYDEFGYLLQSDTFASGRLTNAPHPLWPFFESVYVLQQPTYSTKFPPGQGLTMAVGQRLLGNPWFGVWLSAGVLMATLCWALQGWLPPAWALLGAFFALPLCVSSYWMNSYWGGAVAAIGGALVFGSYARLVRRPRVAYAIVLGLGLVILALTRMYEGLVFSIPILFLLLSGSARRVRVWAPMAVVVALGLTFTLAYDYRVTGHAFRLPYIEYNRQYGYAPPFNVLPLQTEVVYRHESLFNLHHGWEYEQWQRSRSWHVLVDRSQDWMTALFTLTGGAPLALVLIAFLGSTLRDRRMRLAKISLGTAILGSLVEIAYYPHYAAPVTAAVILILVQSVRHLRLLRVDTALGRYLSRAIPTAACLLLLGSAGVRLWRPQTIEQTQPVNARRDKLAATLRTASVRRHVIIVRYTGNQNPHEEWVYNRADIDAAEVVWAHDMGAMENQRLVDYFKDRDVWLLEPDHDPERLLPYTLR